MKNKAILPAALFLLLGAAGCVKHEIIPAPEKKVELKCHFEGTVNGAGYEFTQNVLGYTCESNKTKVINPFGPSTAIYYSEIKSDEYMTSVRLNLGSVGWDATTSNDPPLTTFTDFMENIEDTSPAYAAGGANGFEVVFRDGNGLLWTSKDSDASNTIDFTSVMLDSDASGDYAKFVAEFSCIVYHTYPAGGPNPDDPGGPVLSADLEKSFPIANATFKGWFKR